MNRVFFPKSSNLAPQLPLAAAVRGGWLTRTTALAGSSVVATREAALLRVHQARTCQLPQHAYHRQLSASFVQPLEQTQ